MLQVKSFSAVIASTAEQASGWVCALESKNTQTNAANDLSKNNVAETESAFYIYRQSRDGHHQTGLLAAVDVEDFLSGKIKPHEQTRKEKIAHLSKNLAISNFDAVPVFLVHRASPRLKMALAQAIVQAELVADLNSPDGSCHKVWKVKSDTSLAATLQKAVSGLTDLYVADGHHRVESMSKLYAQGNGTQHRCLLALLVPHNEVRLDSYNRILTGISDPKKSTEQLEKSFDVVGRGQRHLSVQKGEFGLWSGKEWIYFTRKKGAQNFQSPIEAVNWQREIFERHFGVVDPTIDSRLHFVPGNEGQQALEKNPQRQHNALGFAFAAPTVEEVMSAADRSQLFPPHSTWFDFKPLPGLVMRSKKYTRESSLHFRSRH